MKYCLLFDHLLGNLPDMSPATFDTPTVDRPFSPAAPTIREQRPDDPTPSSISNKSTDITDKHTLGMLHNITLHNNTTNAQLWTVYVCYFFTIPQLLISVRLISTCIDDDDDDEYVL